MHLYELTSFGTLIQHTVIFEDRRFPDELTGVVLDFPRQYVSGIDIDINICQEKIGKYYTDPVLARGQLLSEIYSAECQIKRLKDTLGNIA